jgi:hypothetical protein
MAATIPSTALVPVQPVFAESEQLALAGFLAGYRGLTRKAYTLGWDAVVIGEYERAFYGSQYAVVAPLVQHYGVQLWTPEAGGKVDFASEHDERAMTGLGLS